MPKRLRDNPLNQRRAKKNHYYDNYLRPFFEKTVTEKPSGINTPIQPDPIKIQEKSTDNVHQSSETCGIGVDAFYMDYDPDDDNDDAEDLF
ncbi:MAG: hypothetical protein ACRD3Z_03910 [Nitrososphaerales archaeon]